MHVMLQWLVNALIIVVVARLLPGFRLRKNITALWVALVLGILGVFVGPALRFVLHVLALPLTIVTFGLFAWVVAFLANTALLWLTDKLLASFRISDTRTLFIGSALISALQFVAARVLHF